MKKSINVRVLTNFWSIIFKKLKIWFSRSLFFLNERKHHLKTKTISASQLVPAVAKKPSVVLRWGLTSHWFYISIFLLIILMNTVVPSAVDVTLSKIYPQIETKKLFGLIVNKSDDPRIVGQRTVIMKTLWVVAWGVSAYVLLLSLPTVVRKTTSKARQTEVMADKMIATKPSESILLYNKALKFAVDQDYESVLKNKIDTLDDRIKTGYIEAPSAPSAQVVELKKTGTVLLSNPIDSIITDQESVIGPNGRYRIEKQLGQGAMGVVFLAQDQILLRKVSLKKLPAGLIHDQNVIHRFQQEARALAQLSHPNIVQIYDFVQEESQRWIAMEYVEGEDLGSILERTGKYAIHDAVKLCIPIADAMAYAHSKGVIHRDFKPSNVMLNSNGEPKIMDFGLAKISQSSIATMEGSLLGSPAFMSPEQARGEPVDHLSDIYAMGVTLFQLVTGELPFEGELKSVLAQKITDRHPNLQPLDDLIPSDLAKIVKQMVESDPKNRPHTMIDVGQALKNLS